MPRYQLKGEQVEPDASYWSCKPYLRTVTLGDLKGRFNPTVFGPATEAADLTFLEALRDGADKPAFFAGGVTALPPADRLAPLSIYLKDSPFIDQPPVGAVVSRRPGGPLIVNGVELATLFEAETPGLWHRHVLNVLLDQPVSTAAGSPLFRETLSPPRQALYWHLLDAAIDSALAAVWHFKWLATSGVTNPAVRDAIRFRGRPSEAGLRDIVYDRNVLRDKPGNLIRNPGDTRPSRRCDPSTNSEDCRPSAVVEPGQIDSPGTPRHPAYGSGHSTYSQAASRVMEFILEQDDLPSKFHTGWQALADNIGQARFWGGVHWRDDHTFGQALGNAVGEHLIEQLGGARVPTPICVACEPPDPVNDLEPRETAFCPPAAAPAPAPAPAPADKKQFRVNPNSSQGAAG